MKTTFDLPFFGEAERILRDRLAAFGRGPTRGVFI